MRTKGIIATLAVGWHLCIYFIRRRMERQKNEPPLGRILKLIEKDLIRKMRDLFKTLPRKRQDKFLCGKNLKEMKNRLWEIENHETVQQNFGKD